MKQSLLILISFLMLASCKVNKTVAVSTASRDSTVSKASEATHVSVQSTETKEIRDTAIGIPARSVKDELSFSDLLPAYTASGQEVSRLYQKTNNGVHAYVTRLPGGAIEYGCDVDSLTLVINNLIREKQLLSHRADSIAIAYNYEQHSASSTEVITYVKGFFKETWYLWVLLGVITILFIVFKYFF